MPTSDATPDQIDSFNTSETRSRRRILFLYSLVFAGAIWTINGIDSTLKYPVIFVAFGTGYVVLKAISDEARALWRTGSG